MQSDAKNLPEIMSGDCPENRLLSSVTAVCKGSLRYFASSIRNGRGRYNEAIVRNSSEVKRIEAAARFCSRCAIEEVPGIGSIMGERCSSQASEIWLGVAP